MKRLAGKTAIVTGSARGIGAAIAERLAADGAAVVVNYIKAAEAAEEVASRIRDGGARAIVVRADVGRREDMAILVDLAKQAFGSVDIVVNNAVSLSFGPLGSIDSDAMALSFATNVYGPLWLVEAALPYLAAGGRVINISSVAQTFPLAGHGVYAGTKGALDAMTRVWATELGPKGITVNAVAPGPVETDAMRENLAPEMKEAFRQRTPLGRIGEPADIAGVVSFLASPDAALVTGHVLVASGGFIP